MASEVEQLLRTYRSHVAVPWQDHLSGPEKVWFLIYRPESERRIMFQLEEFETATRDARHGWVRIDLANRYSAWLGRQRNKEGYFASPGVIPEKRFTEDLSAEVTPEVAAAGPNDVVVITSAMSLFGVAKLSELIKGTENRKPGIDGHVKGRLLVLFPGSREGSTNHFLESTDSWNYLAVPLLPTGVT